MTQGRMQQKSPITRVLDAIGSVPFGVTLMVLILLWCWVGSAGTAPFGAWFVRQSFEKTEMEWFSWWPFNVLLGLLALSLVLVTVRRIKFNLPNLGVWTIHAGVCVLMLGCALYFGLKVEGDMAVYRRQAVVTVDDGPPARLTLRDGEQTFAQGAGRAYRVAVASLQSDYELLTGDDKGKKTYAAQLAFEPLSGGGSPFVRQVLVGYPGYTEDVVPGQGRAIKVLGRSLVDQAVTVDVDYAPMDRIHVMDRYALGVRTSPRDAWTEYPLKNLPRYHEYVSRPGDAWVRPGEPGIPVRALDLRPRATTPRPEFEGLEFRVTAYLPYAQLQESWEPGGPGVEDGSGVEDGAEVSPYADVTVKAGKDVSRHALLAFVPDHDSAVIAGGVPLAFRWARTPDELQRLRAPGAPFLRVTAGGVTQDVTLAEAADRDVALRGTPYRLRVTQFQPDWGGAGSAGSSLALVRVTGGPRPFLRAVVAPGAEFTRDLDEHGQRLPALADPAIAITLENVVRPGLTIAASEAGAHALLVSSGGQVLEQPLAPGTPARFLDGALEVTLHALSARARRVAKPLIVPVRERDQKSGPAFSLIKVEARRGDDVRETWLEYSHYGHPSRVGFAPRRIDFPGMRSIELVYTRQTHKLPAAVALEDFRLEVFPGGERERDFISRVRFYDAEGRPGEPEAVHSNNPTEHDGWWFFQSTWDPPEPNMGYAGLNYTGLGVGNRHGVGIMLLGSAMTVLGTIWAFYVKPVILRRRVRDALEAAAARAGTAPAAVRAGAGDISLSVGPDFAAGVDLSRIRIAALQEDGRVKTLDSLAREKLQLVNRSVRGADPVLVFLDLLLAPEHYANSNVIELRKPAFRRQLLQAVRTALPPEQRLGVVSEPELERVQREGLVSQAFLAHPAVAQAVSVLERDLMRTGKEVQQLHAARAYADARVLASLLRMVPAPGARDVDPWLTVYEIAAAPHGGARHASMGGDEDRALAAIGRLNPALRGSIAQSWLALAEAWRVQDPAAASRALNTLAADFASANPRLYPSEARRGWEHWYYRHDKLTTGWLIFFFALPFLLMATVYGFRWARRVGLALFVLGFGLQTFSLALRWWLAGRIPNANMFEAITASAWFGSLLALALELFLRRWPVKNLPALAASSYAMLALMVGRFVPVLLPGTFHTDIGTVMPVLDRTIWLYIHTNMIIASYALIFFGAVTSLFYLVLRAATALFPARQGLQAAWAGDSGVAAVRGGASSIIMGRGLTPGDAPVAGLARSLDGATMIFLELAFVTLWLGTILGAVWAYFSWGRPWGWDPKEVFALNTWIVFLVLVHVRLKVKDKAFWTAVLALIGCAVMLFNWVAVNFVIVGLHSYA